MSLKISNVVSSSFCPLWVRHKPRTSQSGGKGLLKPKVLSNDLLPQTGYNTNEEGQVEGNPWCRELTWERYYTKTCSGLNATRSASRFISSQTDTVRPSSCLSWH